MNVSSKIEVIETEMLISDFEENNIEHMYVQTAIDAGRIAISNGAITDLATDIMERIMLSSGATDCEASILSTTLIARMGDLTELGTVTARGVNLDRVAAVNDVADRLSSGEIKIGQAAYEIEEIHSRPGYSNVAKLLAYMSITMSLPLILSGNLYDVVSTAFCGGLLAVLSLFFGRTRISSFACILTQSFLATVSACLCVLVTGGRGNFDIIVTASMGPLFAGIAITNSIRETLQGDYISGTGRLMEAIVKTLALSLGVAFGLRISMHLPYLENLTPVRLAVTEWWHYPLYFSMGFLFCLGFSINNGVAKRFLIISAFIGALGKLNFIFLVSAFPSVNDIEATFATAILATLLAHIASHVTRTPSTSFLLPAIMALVPGAALYNSIFTVIHGNYAGGSSALIGTFLCAIAIAAGVFLVDTIVMVIYTVKNGNLFK